MQYAVSDIHGCYDKYIELLRRIDLKESDTLYVLGDMIDRGPDGLKILMDISLRPNIIPFLGNHEYAALTCLPWLMEELTEENTEPDKLLWRLKSVQGWMSDGGDKTVAEFRRLSLEARQDVLDILEDLTVYEEAEAGGREFVLVHAGLGGFSPDKALDDYQLDELILSRPEPGQVYFPDKYLVFGHTPTPYYMGVQPEDARIYRKDMMIAIDCGCASGGPLGCICLDTLEEIYV